MFFKSYFYGHLQLVKVEFKYVWLNFTIGIVLNVCWIQAINLKIYNILLFIEQDKVVTLFMFIAVYHQIIIFKHIFFLYLYI